MIPTGLGLLIFIPSLAFLSLAIYFLLNEIKIFNFQKVNNIFNAIIALGISVPAMYLLSFLSPFIGAVSIFTIFTVKPKDGDKMQLGILLSILYFIVAFAASFFI